MLLFGEIIIIIIIQRTICKHRSIDVDEHETIKSVQLCEFLES